jgi:CubicO group peptidase (beta-lactamase class C family)
MRYDFTRLDALLRRFASETVPSCACAVMKDGQLLYEGYYGYSDLETKTPVTSASLYRQASMTKLVTYTIMMILLEQGKYHMTQPLSDFFPAWANKNKFVRRIGGGWDIQPLEKPITVGDCTAMMCGMPYCFAPAPADTDDPVRRAMSEAMQPLWDRGHYRVQEAIAAMAKVPVAFEPGTDWMYGFGSEIVGGIVELLTDRLLYQAMRDYIFTPLGMSDTDTLFRDDLESRLVGMYAARGTGFVRMPADIDRGQRPGEENEEGRPSLMTNVRDFSKLMQLWAHDGEYQGVRLCKAETMRLMRRNLLSGEVLAHFQGGPDGYNAGYGYGYGVRTLLAPRKGCGSVGSYGWTGGFGSWCEADPVEHSSIVYMHNMTPNREQEHHLPVRAAAYAALRGE